jgi:hypothetical protein
MTDFNNHVLKYNKPGSWKLDDGLAEILTEINKNEYIQTLYSKKPDICKPGLVNESYLKICYDKKIELKLFREIIPDFKCSFNDPYSEFYYTFSLPKLNPNYIASEEPLGLDCTDDKYFFNINTIQLTIKSENLNIHAKFWIKIKNSLSSLRP